MILSRRDVTLGILAGGQARRLEGADKAMALHQGGTLLARTLAALGPGYAQVMLSYNREPSAALSAMLRVVPDLRPEFPGPLAGIEALLAACETEWLFTVPVDLCEIPEGLFESLHVSALVDEGVRAGDVDGTQPLVAVWRVRVARIAVGQALDAGEGSVRRVQEQLGFRTFGRSDWRFGNLNTPADLQP
jgi:molybdopterin-guanine dinucleotide biosynthesis protein A